MHRATNRIRAQVRRHRRHHPSRCWVGRPHDGKRLDQLCDYITRPALSDERVQLERRSRCSGSSWSRGVTAIWWCLR